MKLALARLAALLILFYSPLDACAAVITSASQVMRGNIVELHFHLRGRGLSWYPTAQHQQLTINLAGARLELAPHPLKGTLADPVKEMSAYASGPREARLVFAVSGRVDYAIAIAGSQLIVRFAPAGTAADIAAPLVTHTRERLRSSSRREISAVAANSSASELAGASYPRDADFARSNTARPVSPAPESAPLVMIDPGHGGHDPGALSHDGLAEKNLALQIALRLRAALLESGIRAQMTRTDDHFVSLAERTQMANRMRADLFVSIHLNSSPDSSTTGIEAYYLNNTTDRATIRLARMENGGIDGYTTKSGANLGYILADLRQSYKADEAQSLAQMIGTDATATIADRTGRRINDLGARSGPFYVLVGAEMPSVLVECGFLSNPVEADRLADPRYQTALAEGIAQALVSYLDSKVAVGNL